MKGGICREPTAELIMNGNLWWIYDGLAAVVLIVFAIITIKRGLIKGVVSCVGFILAAGIAVSASPAIAGALYGTAAKTANIKELNKTIDDNTLIDELSLEMENMDYGLSIDDVKLRKVLAKADDYDEELFKFANNIYGRKVAEEEEFMPDLHKAYSNITRTIIGKHLSKYAAESAAQKVLEKPSLFTAMIPLLLETEDHSEAAEYICDNLVDEPYNYSFRLIALIALMAAVLVFALIMAGAIGRNDTMEPGLGRHLFCGIFGLIKGAAVVFLIAAAIRASVVYGTKTELMNEYPAIDRSYAFKYVYDIVCGLK